MDIFQGDLTTKNLVFIFDFFIAALYFHPYVKWI